MLRGRFPRALVSGLLMLLLAFMPALADHGSGHMEASFSPVPGNEWWVETYVAADEPLAGVDARVDGGTWIALEKKSWGAWAKSFHVPDGSIVEFRARSVDGDAVVSGPYTWPEAEPAGGGGSEMGASFAPVSGNEWWVEVYVTADEPLAGVAARDDEGPWMDLAKKSWGAWAKSFHVESGSIIEFRATSTDGDQVQSQGYVWPSAKPAGAGEQPPDATDVAFGPKAGNEWWIETLVVADATITGVEAKADGGAWHKLTLRGWGAWAASFHAPAGSTVTFRATTSDGTDTSEGFVWPGADVVGGGGPWPEEGSYARYATSASDPAPSQTQGHRTMIHHDGQWWVYERKVRDGPDGTTTSEDFCTTGRTPTGPTDVSPGDRVDVQTGTCFDSTYDVFVRHADTYSTHQDGDPVTAPTWYGSRTDPCQCLEWEAEWSQANGLLAFARQAGRGSVVAELEDTNAPIG